MAEEQQQHKKAKIDDKEAKTLQWYCKVCHYLSEKEIYSCNKTFRNMQKKHAKSLKKHTQEFHCTESTQLAVIQDTLSIHIPENCTGLESLFEHTDEVFTSKSLGDSYMYLEYVDGYFKLSSEETEGSSSLEITRRPENFSLVDIWQKISSRDIVNELTKQLDILG